MLPVRQEHTVQLRNVSARLSPLLRSEHFWVKCSPHDHGVEDLVHARHVVSTELGRNTDPHFAAPVLEWAFAGLARLDGSMAVRCDAMIMVSVLVLVPVLVLVLVLGRLGRLAVSRSMGGGRLVFLRRGLRSIQRVLGGRGYSVGRHLARQVA